MIRFGRIVRDRREELGLRQDELKAIGGPSSTTMVKVEKGTPPAPTPLTLRRLDAALDWVDGSAAATLAGGEPSVAAVGIDEEGPAVVAPARASEVGRSAQTRKHAAATIWEALKDTEGEARAVAEDEYVATHAGEVCEGLKSLSLATLILLPREDFHELLRITRTVELLNRKEVRRDRDADVAGRASYGILQYQADGGELRPVAAARRDRGLTLQDVSDAIATQIPGFPPPSKGTLSAAEQGKRGVSRGLADALEVVLGLPPRSILSDGRGAAT